MYELGDAPFYNKNPEWVKDKEDGLGLDFPDVSVFLVFRDCGSKLSFPRIMVFLHPPVQLPYYIDKDVRLTQSMAISRYLARKHGLVADSEEAEVRQDLAEYQLLDFRAALVKLAYHEYVSLSNVSMQICCFACLF